MLSKVEDMEANVKRNTKQMKTNNEDAQIIKGLKSKVQNMRQVEMKKKNVMKTVWNSQQDILCESDVKEPEQNESRLEKDEENVNILKL